MLFYIVLIFYILQTGILKVASFQLSLVQHGNEDSDLLFDRSTSKAFCYPTEEMMAMMSDGSGHHKWGFSTFLNYSVSLERVGQVFCRQLGFSVYERIVPKAIEEKREKILWGAECLGYEASITHCFYEEIQDPDINCTNFVGLKCSNCENKLYTINSNETLVLTSPGFPNIYNDNSVCRWTVIKDVPSSFVVNIKFLSLPPRNLMGHCSQGDLDIMSRKEEPSDYVIHATLCGTLENKIILVNNSILDLKLHSGLFHPRPYGPAGFRVVISTLQDLQTKGKMEMSHSLSTLEIVGISFGIAALLILLIPISLILKFLIRRRQRLRRHKELAKKLHRRVTPTTPCMQTSIKMTPLPAVPKKLCNKILNTVREQERKSSISSGIYEDIRSKKSISYLNLEDINKNCDESKSSKYNFNIPTFLFTPFNEEDSKSAPSDIPSCSFASEIDSVFGSASEKSEVDQFTQTKIERRATYTVVKPKISLESNSRSSSPLNASLICRNKRFSDLQNFGQRCFSDSDVSRVKMNSIPDLSFKSLQKTYTQRFSLSKP